MAAAGWRASLWRPSARGRRVVIKVLSPELAAEVSATRFEREIRLAASLQQANIVPVLSAGETDGIPHYTMPFVEGRSDGHHVGDSDFALLVAEYGARWFVALLESGRVLRSRCSEAALAHAEPHDLEQPKLARWVRRTLEVLDRDEWKWHAARSPSAAPKPPSHAFPVNPFVSRRRFYPPGFFRRRLHSVPPLVFP